METAIIRDKEIFACVADNKKQDLCKIFIIDI
jgi:hypothetical protein